MSLAPEDTVAAAVVSLINAGSYEYGTITAASRLHRPRLEKENLDQLEINVYPVNMTEDLLTRAGSVSRDVKIGIQVVQDEEQLDVSGQDRMAYLSYEIDLIVRGPVGTRVGGHVWHGSERLRADTEWMSIGVFASVITAHYRKPGA